MMVVHADALPAPVERWLRRAYPDGIPDIDTFEVIGSASVRLGALPPLRVSAHMSHRLGHDHVTDIRWRVGGLPLLRVMDAYVDGHGLAKIGPWGRSGPDIDQAALLSTWGEAVVMPCAWRRLPALTVEPIDAASVRLTLPTTDGPVLASLSFDPDSGLPAAFEAVRYKGTTGRRVGWRGDYLDWRTIDGLPFPGRWLVGWADEPRPWFDMRIDHLRTSVPIDAALERARRAIERADATGASERHGMTWE
jgi:hypothetical protein